MNKSGDIDQQPEAKAAGFLAGFLPPEEQNAQSEAVRDKATEHAEAAVQDVAQPNRVLLRWIAKLGAGVVSLLGLTGFVGLVGSAVLWQRFTESGLPATQALAAVPENQRIIEGASGLVASLVLGTLAVTFLFAVDRAGQINRWSKLVLIGLWLGAATFVALSTDLSFLTTVALAALGLALVGVSMGVGTVTGRQFVPFAFAVFSSTVVFAAAVNYAIAAQQNFAEPAAVLRSAEGAGIRGLYVADDADNIYIGVIRRSFTPVSCEEGKEEETVTETIPLYRIPRTDETRLLIGRAQGFCDAIAESEALRSQLRETVELAPTDATREPAGG